MASTARARPVLPDEILEEIFLRLDAAADLARASAACSSFRRLVSARRFLRRFRSLHPPPALGILWSSVPPQGFVPVEPPHRAAPAARALAEAADFTFSFLPEPSSWCPSDARDGRVVLSRRFAGAAFSMDIVVCDPLHRRYVQIPPIPDELAASVPKRARDIGPYLAPAGDGEGKGEEESSSFALIYIVDMEDKYKAFVFSSAKQEWRLITYLCSIAVRSQRMNAHGSYFWMADSMLQSLVLDTRDMKFSVLDLPPNNDLSERAIVEAGEGRLGLLTFHHGALDLFCKTWHNNAGGAGEWQHDRTIPLPKHSDGSDYDWFFLGASDGYLTLLALQQENHDNHDYRIHSHYFVLDLKTLLLERFYAVYDEIIHSALVYASFPPPLALPTI